MSVTTLFLPLIAGGRIVVLDPGDVVEALDTALRSGRRFGFVKLTPSHLEALRSLSLGRPAPRNTAAFIVGGEALYGATLALWHDEAGDVTIFNEYGPTETVVGCAMYAARAEEIRPGPVPIGRPIANTRLYVLDRYGEPVPAGVPGELYIGGAGVALGYLSPPSASEERFLPDPFVKDSRVYRTGDIVKYRADGTLEFLGRLDGQVKIRGYRVEPGDVEAALRRHAAVADAVVTARDFGRGDRRLLAHVVLAPSERQRSAILQDVREFLRSELPAYMLPSTFTAIRAVPLTSAGKLDVHALDKAASETAKAAAPVAAVTAIERVISVVFEHVLAAQEISVEDDFFADLGGHSLLATQVVARLRDLLRLELPLRSIFEEPTARGLAAAILRRDPARAAEIERVAEMTTAVLDMPEDEVRAQIASEAVDHSEKAAIHSNGGADSESTCA
jgi:acyl-coenzyme A synthetase/AMP-(fatty) acid ligase/acyl carrier protein